MLYMYLNDIHMTLQEAKIYMTQHPHSKFACQVFHNEWISFDGVGFIFEDGYRPDDYWFMTAESWGYDWWLVNE